MAKNKVKKRDFSKFFCRNSKKSQIRTYFKLRTLRHRINFLHRQQTAVDKSVPGAVPAITTEPPVTFLRHDDRRIHAAALTEQCCQTIGRRVSGRLRFFILRQLHSAPETATFLNHTERCGIRYVSQTLPGRFAAMRTDQLLLHFHFFAAPIRRFCRVKTKAISPFRISAKIYRLF